jgi:hypothetical protein
MVLAPRRAVLPSPAFLIRGPIRRHSGLGAAFWVSGYVALGASSGGLGRLVRFGTFGTQSRGVWAVLWARRWSCFGVLSGSFGGSYAELVLVPFGLDGRRAVWIGPVGSMLGVKFRRHSA